MRLLNSDEVTAFPFDNLALHVRPIRVVEGLSLSITSDTVLDTGLDDAEVEAVEEFLNFMETEVNTLENKYDSCNNVYDLGNMVAWFQAHTVGERVQIRFYRK